jgi:hypothetical protein
MGSPRTFPNAGSERSYAVDMTSFASTRGPGVGPAARPVSIPDDLDTTQRRVIRGRVALPLRVRWSGPPRTYDLDDPHDRLMVYEQVMAEGTDDDVRSFIDVDEVVELWKELVLPRHVRRAWVEWLREHRGLTLSC